jgi:hypothetical protein
LTPDENNPHIGYQSWVMDREDDDISVSSELSTGPKDAILRPDTFEHWQGDALPATLTIDLGQARSVDYVGIAGHTIGTDDASVLVEYSSDDINYTTFADSASPAGNTPLLFLDEEISRRYWRITLTGSGDVPKIAVIYIGQVLVMLRKIYGGHSPAVLSRDTLLYNNMSDGGQFLGQYVRRRGVNGAVNLTNLPASWYRENFDPFVKAARENPFFFAWRPIDWPDEIAFGWTDKNIQPVNMGIRDLMQVKFDFHGIGYID